MKKLFQHRELSLKLGSNVILYDVLLKSIIFFVKHIVEIAKERISRSYEIAYPAQYG